MDPKQLQAAIEAIKNGDGEAALKILEAMLVSGASGGEAPPAEPTAGAADGAAAASALRATFPGVTISEAIGKLESLSKRIKDLDAEAASLESAQRVELVAELVKLGFETPGTAWQGDAANRTPVQRLMSEPLKDLRERVTALRATPRVEQKPPPTGDAGADGKAFTTPYGVVKLSAREIKNCEELKADLQAYAENKAIQATALRK